MTWFQSQLPMPDIWEWHGPQCPFSVPHPHVPAGDQSQGFARTLLGATQDCTTQLKLALNALLLQPPGCWTYRHVFHFTYLLFYVYVCFVCECMYTRRVPGAHRSQKEGIRIKELSASTEVLGIEPGVLWKSSQCF